VSNADTDTDRARLFDGIEADLAGVEAALGRLDGGAYFTCAGCDGPLSDDWLAQHPVAQRCEACTSA
jgi:RNA polymerase-binding transcription factor DksA